MNRRDWIKTMLAVTATATLLPLRAWAVVWNKPAFEAKQIESALKGLGVELVGPTRDIVLVAPDLAENGAIVQIEVESWIPDTESIMILAEKNPTALIAHYTFSNGAIPAIVTRIKLAETGDIKAVVKANGKYYEVARKVSVAEGGCG